MSTRSHSAYAPKTRKSREPKGKTIKYSRKWDFTESVEVTHIFIFVVASIMVLMAGMNISLGDLDWLGLSTSIRSYEISLIESVGGAILVFAYALSRVVKRELQ